MGGRKSNHRDWESRFQDAALDPGQWLAALQDLADATGSARAELVGVGGTNAARFNWLTSVDSSQLDEFNRLQGYRPDLNFRIAADMGSDTLSVVHEADYDKARLSLRRDDYVDFCERHHMIWGCQSALLRDAGALIGLSVLRSRADGRTNEEDRRIFAESARAARTAVRMQRAIEHQGFRLLAGTLEAMSLPCFLLDGHGRVEAMTPTAENLLASPSLLRLWDHRLSSHNDEARRRIDLALRSVLDGARRHERVPLYTVSPVPEIVLDIFSLSERVWTFNFAPRVLVVVRDPGRSLRGGAGVLAATFGLTPAEAQIAVGLGEGRSREHIASGRGVSLETLRAQLKSIYHKTGCSRETELVLLVRALLD